MKEEITEKFIFKIDNHILKSVSMNEICLFMKKNYNDYHWDYIERYSGFLDINQEYPCNIPKESRWGFKFPDYINGKSYYLKRVE